MSIDSAVNSAIALHVGDQALGLPIGEIREIIEPVRPVRVPMTHPFFAGLISLRGKIVPLIRLSGIFHAERNPFAGEDEKYVICTADDQLAALDIHSVGDIFAFHSADVTPVDGERKLVKAKLKLENGELSLINIRQLVGLIKSLNDLERS